MNLTESATNSDLDETATPKFESSKSVFVNYYFNARLGNDIEHDAENIPLSYSFFIQLTADYLPTVRPGITIYFKYNSLHINVIMKLH